MVIPTRRSTAEALQILVSHALGDAGSPYLVGVVSLRIFKILIFSLNFKFCILRGLKENQK